MVKQNDNPQGKNWCFTANNYEDEAVARQLEKLKKDEDIQWCIMGKETAPTTGTPHIQGAVVFTKRYRKKQLWKRFDYRFHWEQMFGTPEQSKTYCSKEDKNPYERGIMPEAPSKSGGKATKEKWDDIRKKAEMGKFNDIPSKIWIRYHSSLKAIRAEALKDDNMEDVTDKDIKKHFLWLWGPTGTGKSHTARRIAKEIAPDEEPYMKDLNKWWGNYKCQKVTLIEEADKKRCEHLASFFKKWCDKWSFTAEGKGISYDEGIRPNYVIVTSNYEIRECFPEPEDYLPLERRFTIVNLTSKDQYVYWPKTQAEIELERECDVTQPTGNTGSPPAVSHSPPPSQPPFEEEEIVDLEEEEEKVKRRRCIDDSE